MDKVYISVDFSSKWQLAKKNFKNSTNRTVKPGKWFSSKSGLAEVLLKIENLISDLGWQWEAAKARRGSDAVMALASFLEVLKQEPKLVKLIEEYKIKATAYEKVIWNDEQLKNLPDPKYRTNTDNIFFGNTTEFMKDMWDIHQKMLQFQNLYRKGLKAELAIFEKAAQAASKSDDSAFKTALLSYSSHMNRLLPKFKACAKNPVTMDYMKHNIKIDEEVRALLRAGKDTPHIKKGELKNIKDAYDKYEADYDKLKIEPKMPNFHVNISTGMEKLNKFVIASMKDAETLAKKLNK